MTLKPTCEASESGPNEGVTKAVEPNRAERGQGELEESFLAKKSVAFVAGILILLGLYLSSLYNYLLFHSLTEIFSIVVAWTIFILAWNSRRIIDNNYLLFIGIAFLFIGGLDLVHMLGYKGMGIFHGYAANLPTQLWIAARYMESLSFFIAPMFLTRRLRADLALIVYALVTALVLGLVFYWHIFPTCFVEGVGLTPFKKISEYIISIILIGAITFLFQKRKEFDEKVFRLLVAAMVITIAAELAFTFYISAYGFSNLVGHYFKIISFYLIYKAIIETGLTKPYNLLFRNLKQNEEALRESEASYRSLFENANLAFSRSSLDGKIMAANPEFIRMFGYESLDDLNTTVKNANELFADPQRRAEIVRLWEENPVLNRFENAYLRKDGSKFIGKLTTKAIMASDDRLQFFEGFIEDITERKQAEEALRESEERFRLLASSSPVGIFQADSEGNGIYVNEKVREFTGFTQEEHFGDGWSKAIYPDDRKDVFREWRRMIEGDGGFKTEFRFLSSDGVVTWVSTQAVLLQDDSNRKTGFIGTLTDITERKLFEEAFRFSENRYMEILENVLVGVYQVTLDGKFIFANQKMIQMFGYSSYEELEAIGSIAELYAKPEERPEVVDEIISKGFINKEVEYKHKDGQSVWVKLHTRKSKNKEGAIILEGLAEDVTEIRKIETQLQQSQKMEAVGTLAGGIAHDFNNILAIILGNTQLASEDVPDWNPAGESLKEIYNASIRARDMVKQLLAFSRKTDEESKPLNMVPIIKESVKMLRSAIPTSVEFRQHISDDLCSVMGDATQINQIVMNLVTNAVHSMPEEVGLLEVTLENMSLLEEKSCFDWVLSPGAYVRLKVRDTGEGIAPTIIDRIFEPYYTTKEIGKGTGMGLSMIHGMVRRQGGGIRVESELGEGTLFEIYFPALEETAEEEKTSEGEIKGGSERILFVDDEASVVNLNRQRLERLGYQVKSTTKPLEALEWFKADPDQFDVIITDMTMPRMTGDKLTAEILKIRPHMPVIICTGYSC
jgi:PAS domain S-box-containing protein